MKTNLNLYEMYVGHDNSTKERFKERLICNICNEFFIGYTIIKSEGYYKGTKEASYLIKLISNEATQVNKLKTALQLRLNQESILLTTHTLQQAEF